jgi:hypothetical protein
MIQQYFHTLGIFFPYRPIQWEALFVAGIDVFAGEEQINEVTMSSLYGHQ